MTCTSPKSVRPKGWYYSLKVPCGCCMNCRIARAREWSVRLYHEKSSWSQSVFLTLTYDDDHLPANGQLVKKHLVDFLKLLRYYYKKPIKYYACGEYGETTNRPHYHLLIYGLGLDDLSQRSVIKSWNKCIWTPQRIQSCFGLVTYESIKYVARYINKKVIGRKEVSPLQFKGSAACIGLRQEAFSLQSKGLGKEFALKNAEQIKSKLGLTIYGQHVGLPRYYRKILGIEGEVMQDIAQSELIKQVNYLIDNNYLSVTDSKREGFIAQLGLPKYGFVPDPYAESNIELDKLLQSSDIQRNFNTLTKITMYKKDPL